MFSFIDLLNSLCICDSDMNELELNDVQKVKSFVHSFVPSHGKTIVYRGNGHLDKQFNLEEKGTKVTLPEYLFSFGDKSYYFWVDDVKADINSLDRRIFISIWDHIHKTITKVRRIHSINLRQHIRTFINGNEEFVAYFKDTTNKQAFLNQIMGYKPGIQKQIRDYYLGFIHTRGCKPDTSFLSTSRNYKVAKKFAGEKGIILVGWVVNNNTLKHQNTYIDANDCQNKIIQNLGLPTYSLSLYPEQQELSLKCGLLPHYMLGFQMDNDFIVNPSMVHDIQHRTKEDIIENGFNIDQSKIFNWLKNTSYKRIYGYYDGNFFSM